MSKRPNILFVMADQLRWDALGCTGGWVHTPHIDRIAGEGVLFPNCVTGSPVCVSARISLATGLYCHNTGVWNNGSFTLPVTTPTWMQAIRRAGYRTSLFGKSHLYPHGPDLRETTHLMNAYGLDDVDEIAGPRASASVVSHMTARWDALGLWQRYREDYAERFAHNPFVARPSPLPLEEYADVYVGQQAARYLESYERSEPWFCWVSFGGPHEPWDAPEPYASMYDPDTMPPPTPVPDWSERRVQGGLDWRLQHLPGLSAEDVRAMRANYAGNVTLIDDQIGEILKVVSARGELDNTIIAFTSDHGEFNGDHGLVYKSAFLDGAVRVPLIVRTAQSPASAAGGQRCQAPVELADLGPTLVELAGGELGYQQFAVSLCPALDDPASQPRLSALSELNGEIMALTSEWKIALNRSGEAYMLIDTVNDPDEQRNLAGDPGYGAVKDQLRLHLLERLVTSQSYVTATKAILAQWKKAGPSPH